MTLVSIFYFLGCCHSWFIGTGQYYHLKPDIVMLLALFLLRIAVAISGLLCFSMNFRVFVSICARMWLDFGGNCPESIFTLLMQTIDRHGSFQSFKCLLQFLSSEPISLFHSFWPWLFLLLGISCFTDYDYCPDLFFSTFPVKVCICLAQRVALLEGVALLEELCHIAYGLCCLFRAVKL